MSRSFTVALPVRNGGVHLRLCVESVLNQSFGEFDLVILDNASDDGTEGWLCGLNDSRVKVLRSSQPLSIEANWSRILGVSKNEFLTTIGHDDLLDVDFLSIMVELIKAHPEAGLYLTHFRLIDAGGKLLRPSLPMPARESAGEYLAARLCRIRDSFGTGHVMRSSAYDSLGGIPAYRKLLFADDSLFLQLIGQSYRATAPDEAFSYRFHPTSVATAAKPEDLFAALEEYAAFLDVYQQQDAAVGKILRRYFPYFAAAFGGDLYSDALQSAFDRRMKVDPAVMQRVRRLVMLFNTDAPADITLYGSARLLERACASRAWRAFYQARVGKQKLSECVTAAMSRLSV